MNKLLIKRKKGFTLIELLAVIVILAVIALIAVPIMLNIIDNARKQAYLDSVYGIIKSAENYYGENYILNENKIDKTENILSKLTYSGEKPQGESRLYLNESGKVSLYIRYEDTCYTKAFNSEEVSINECSKLEEMKSEITSTGKLTLYKKEVNDKIYDLCKGITILDRGSEINCTNDIVIDLDNISSSVGKYNINYEYIDENEELIRLTREVEVIDDVTEYTTANSTTNPYYTYEAASSGYYKIELWGAQGGSSESATGGKGGYTSGVINLNEGTDLFIYVGGQGTSTPKGVLQTVVGGYNGGGLTGGQAVGIRMFGSGGGASDIRYGGTLVNDRIMVAAGGGGSFYNIEGANNMVNNGGDGGSLIGSNGTQSIYNSTTYTDATFCYGEGGTQISGGKITEDCSYSNLYKGITGTFFQGGETGSGATGGGGGYYGGARSGHLASAGGGSSFISGYAGVNAITSASSLTATNNTIHYSGKYFIDGNMTAGTNSGSGEAKITYLGSSKPTRSNTKLNGVRYIKDCINANTASTGEHWIELQAINNGINVAKNKSITATGNLRTDVGSGNLNTILNGDFNSDYTETTSNNLSCITVDLGSSYNLDEIVVWHYWKDGRTYYEKNISVSSDNSTWETVFNDPNNEIKETSEGIRISAYK